MLDGWRPPDAVTRRQPMPPGPLVVVLLRAAAARCRVGTGSEQPRCTVSVTCAYLFATPRPGRCGTYSITISSTGPGGRRERGLGCDSQPCQAGMARPPDPAPHTAAGRRGALAVPSCRRQA